MLGRQSGDKRVEAVVADDLDVRSGDLVSLVLAPRNILRAAVIVYGYPLFGAVVAAILAFGIGLGDANGAIAALVGLAAGIFLARIRLKNSQCLQEFTPTVVGRLSPVPD